MKVTTFFRAFIFHWTEIFSPILLWKFLANLLKELFGQEIYRLIFWQIFWNFLPYRHILYFMGKKKSLSTFFYYLWITILSYNIFFLSLYTHTFCFWKAGGRRVDPLDRTWVQLLRSSMSTTSSTSSSAFYPITYEP